MGEREPNSFIHCKSNYFSVEILIEQNYIEKRMIKNIHPRTKVLIYRRRLLWLKNGNKHIIEKKLPNLQAWFDHWTLNFLLNMIIIQQIFFHIFHAKNLLYM